MVHDKKKICGSLLFTAGGKHGRKGKGDPLIAEFIKKLGLSAPKTACLGAASADDPSYYSFVKSVLMASGAGEVFPAKFSDGKRIHKADLIFVSGGDVESGMDILEKTHALGLLTELFRNGIPFAGVSAGSIMMCRSWVRWSNPDDDSTAGIFPCLRFTDFICDTHDEEDDWRELKTALSHCPDGTLGYGLPSGSGLRVDPDGSLHACGDNITVFQSLAGTHLKLDDLQP